ncbi:DUF1127 domain-containing protein [Bradyrhizobium manausense]|uniref:DUF1127 domain-containing protein n=1 Tax=Bradyrhizobium manausense TaxID=989370 RepID=UPI001BA5B3C3|nr:DUF1127 domain-containing protein [Bradyrhizobium manausense]MBR0792183.1 DUF1127 domain-containing protein [Bradyrhizobium manausense]
MSNITASTQPFVLARQAPGFIGRCWNAIQERRAREKVRAALYGLNGRELHDIGIAHCDIEHIVSHPEVDPRGI